MSDENQITFNEWLKTKDGTNCMSWPVTDVNFLRNRLWWAFNAGKESSQFENREYLVKEVKE